MKLGNLYMYEITRNDYCDNRWNKDVLAFARKLHTMRILPDEGLRDVRDCLLDNRQDSALQTIDDWLAPYGLTTASDHTTRQLFCIHTDIFEETEESRQFAATLPIELEGPACV